MLQFCRLAVMLVATATYAGAFSTSAQQLRPVSSNSRACSSLRWKMNVDSVESRLTETQKGGPYKDTYAPYISLFDNPGCPRQNTEYKGKMSGTLDDERCVMVSMEKVFWSESTARTVFYDILPLFNNAYSRAQVASRIAKLNGEAKAKGLPPNKWPFPPGYIQENKASIYSIIPGGQQATVEK